MKNLKVMNNTLFKLSMKQSIKYICMFLMLVGMSTNAWGAASSFDVSSITIDDLDWGTSTTELEGYIGYDAVNYRSIVSASNSVFFGFTIGDEFEYKVLYAVVEDHTDGLGLSIEGIDAGGYVGFVGGQDYSVGGNISITLAYYINEPRTSHTATLKFLYYDGYDPVTVLSIPITINMTGGYTVATAVSPAATGSFTAKVNGSARTRVMSDEQLDLVATPADGYQFLGWTTDGDEDTDWEIDNDMSASTYAYIHANQTITANFEVACTSHTITLTGTPAGTGTNGTFSADKSTACEDETVTLTATPSSGYELYAWTVNKTGGGTCSVNGSNQFTMPDVNVTISATFSAATYSLSFHANGGTGSMDAEERVYNTTAAIPANGFTAPAGKVFDGWATSLGGTKVYEPGANYTMGTGDATLYAHWRDAAYNDYKFACVDPVEAEVTQWTQKDIEVVANIGTANKVVAKMGSTTTGAVSIGTPKTTNTYTFTFNTLDFSEKENKSMILYWRNGSTLTGVSLVTLPSIISLTAGEGGSWDGLAIAPTEDDIVVINEPMTIDVADARAKEVVFKGSGSLSVGAGKALVIAEGIHKFDGSVFVPTTESDINIGSTLAEGTGALVVHGDDGTNKATVNFAVKAKKDGSGHWINQFIGTPFNDENAVLYNYYETQLYEFKADGSGTTTSEWTKLKGSDRMEPFMGYNLLRSKTDDHVLWMQGTLNATNTPVEKHLYYNGSSKTENMLANGWVAPIHIDAFEEDDFGGAEAAIYIFNAGTPEDQGSHSTSDGSASNNSPGQYIALPVASTPWVSPTVTVIPAMQAFSVFATGADQTLTLDYDKLVYTPAQTNVGVVPTRAPRRYRGGEAPEVIRMHVNAESGYNANAYVLGRWDFEEGFDNGWDGRFIEGDEEAPQLYMSTIEGKMVINCVPEIDGTVLDFQRGSADAMYTFTFEYEGDKTWYLNDLKEKKSTRISGENNYTFYSENYDSHSRFVISSLPVNTATGVDRTQGDNVAETKARKIMVNGLLYIIRGGQIYDATGAIVK